VMAQYFMRDFDEEGALSRHARAASSSGPAASSRSRRGLRPAAPRDPLRPRRGGVAGGARAPRSATPVAPACGARASPTAAGHARVERWLGLAPRTTCPALDPGLYSTSSAPSRAAPLGAGLRHNRDDVLSLVALLGWFGPGAGRPMTAPPGRGPRGLGRLWEPVASSAPSRATVARSAPGSRRSPRTGCGCASRGGRSARRAGTPRATCGRRRRATTSSTRSHGRSSRSSTSTGGAISTPRARSSRRPSTGGVRGAPTAWSARSRTGRPARTAPRHQRSPRRLEEPRRSVSHGGDETWRPVHGTGRDAQAGRRAPPGSSATASVAMAIRVSREALAMCGPARRWERREPGVDLGLVLEERRSRHRRSSPP